MCEVAGRTSAGPPEGQEERGIPMQRSFARLVISYAMGARSGSGALGELMDTLQTASSSSGVRELLASFQGSSGPGSGPGGLRELLEALQGASSSGALRDLVAEGLRAVGPTVKGL